MCLIGFWWLFPLVGLLLVAAMMVLCFRRGCCHMAGHGRYHSRSVTFSSGEPSVRGERS
jgi:hypothetical protein